MANITSTGVEKRMNLGSPAAIQTSAKYAVSTTAVNSQNLMNVLTRFDHSLNGSSLDC